ncbi:MAG: hypothetical protein PHR77_12490 [Kiritimatiellae bacterium]|nr:hypothetical protein [Kiritimatiellia bacterium]MDD5520874.1 hypothetical protein [Kiritimatiellia bacterium]
MNKTRVVIILMFAMEVVVPMALAVEPTFDQVAGRYQRQRTYRAYLHTPLDYKIVAAQPVFCTLMQDATLRMREFQPKGKANPRDHWSSDFLHLGVGFLFGENAELFDKNKVWQSFEWDGIPIHTIQAQWGFLTLTQTSFTERQPDGKGMLHIRLAFENINPGMSVSNSVFLSLTFQPYRRYLCVGKDVPGEDHYYSYNPLPDAWRSGRALKFENGDTLMNGDVVAAVLKPSPEVRFLWVAEEKNIKNLLRCDLNIPALKKATLDVTVPYEVFDFYVDELDQPAAELRKAWRFTRADLPALRLKNFDTGRVLCRNRWKTCLNRAAQFQTPERTVDCYVRTALINGLQMLAEEPGKPWLTCGQGGFYPRKFIWSVELAQLLIALDRFGYHDEVRHTLDYFMTTQDGSKGPHGKISSPDGSFAPFVGWMAETGTVLSMVWQHYLCAPDKAWLETVVSRILRGAAFIRRERNASKIMQDGKPVPHYGLLPEASPNDSSFLGHFLFSDEANWQGLQAAASICRELGRAEADELQADADDYLACIRKAIDYATVDKEGCPGIRVINREVYGKKDKSFPYSLYAVDAQYYRVLSLQDARLPGIEAYLRSSGGMTEEFIATMGGRTAYTGWSDLKWNKIWMAKGEREKAVRTFYGFMAYGFSEDLYIGSERFNVTNLWWAPWQPNASNNGRLLEMAGDLIAFEDEGHLVVAAGVPSWWFEPGKRFGLTQFHFADGQLDLECVSDSEGSVMTLLMTDAAKPVSVEIHLPETYRAKSAKLRKGKGTIERIQDGCMLRLQLAPGKKTILRWNT